jgi:hypothetical protein
VPVQTTAQVEAVSTKSERVIEAEVRAKRLVDFALVFTVNAAVSIIVQTLYNVVAVYALGLTSRGWFWGFVVLSGALGLLACASSLIGKCICRARVP